MFHSERQSSGARFARSRDLDLIDWSTVAADPPDFMIASGATRTLHEPGCEFGLIPHGAGHNRFTPHFPGVAGLARGQLRGGDGSLPSYIALPGPAAKRRLALDCPEALPYSEVTGDLCFERLRSSARMRREYRRSLGLKPNRRLVVVSSTWLGHSLFAHYPGLPEALLEALPMDDYAVAFLPHPNVLSAHGSMASLFRRQMENGLIMVDPGEGWRAVLLAADCVVGDHGSVAFYAAALGIPAAVATFGFEEMPPESPLRAFGEVAPAFDPGADLRAQVERLCAGGPVRGDCFAEALAEPDPGPADRVRAGLYRALGLDPVPGPAPRMLPPPVPVAHWRPTSAWRCEVDFADGAATWRRYPGAEGREPNGSAVAATECLDIAARDRADVIVRHGTELAGAEALDEARQLLREQPMATVASVRTGPTDMVWACADGRVLVAKCPPESLDAAPSVWLAAGSPDRGEWRLEDRHGPGSLSVSATR